MGARLPEPAVSEPSGAPAFSRTHTVNVSPQYAIISILLPFGSTCFTPCRTPLLDGHSLIARPCRRALVFIHISFYFIRVHQQSHSPLRDSIILAHLSYMAITPNSRGLCMTVAILQASSVIPRGIPGAAITVSPLTSPAVMRSAAVVGNIVQISRIPSAWERHPALLSYRQVFHPPQHVGIRIKYINRNSSARQIGGSRTTHFRVAEHQDFFSPAAHTTCQRFRESHACTLSVLGQRPGRNAQCHESGVICQKQYTAPFTVSSINAVHITGFLVTKASAEQTQPQYWHKPLPQIRKSPPPACDRYDSCPVR